MFEKLSSTKEPQKVGDLFTKIARRYDLINDVMTLGQDRRWRRFVYEHVKAQQGQKILDLAAGTGTSSQGLDQTGANVISADISLGMLQNSKRRDGKQVCCDVQSLPFSEGTFDTVIVSFGLRNFPDTKKALTEIQRVLKFDGVLVILETSQPQNPVIRHLSNNVVFRYLPVVISTFFRSDPSAYTYFGQTVRAWYGPEELQDLIKELGWKKCSWNQYTLGTVAIHTAFLSP